MSNPRDVLGRIWGYQKFRPLQEDIINSVLQSRDVVALLPTGGGKSLCYQVPALICDGVCIVISPLVALMEDQVNALKSRGVPAEAVHSGKSPREIDIILDNCIYGNTRLLYLSPERLLTPMAAERIKRMNVSFVAIDEAHCISQWGYDFRPSYLQIPVIREWHPDVAFIALTATATTAVTDDIADKLAMREPVVVRSDFARPNLTFNVVSTDKKLLRLINLFESHAGSGLVYVRSRKKTRELALAISQHGIRAEYYHAGLATEERNAVQKRWIGDTTRVVVCTTAFGMGIDKSNVRLVVHYDLPPSLEEYYQESGRAGRDGHDAHCYILYDGSDVSRLHQNLVSSYPDGKQVERVYHALSTFANVAPGYGEGASAMLDLPSFCRHFQLPVNETFHALGVLERDGWIALSDAFYNPPRVQITADKSTIYQYQLNAPVKGELLKALLRNYEGLLLEPVKVDIRKLATVLETDRKTVEAQLLELHREEVIRYTPTSDLPKVTFIRPRPSRNNFTINYTLQERLKQSGTDRLRSVEAYLAESVCRQVNLRKYFGEISPGPCQCCDLCRQRSLKLTREEILARIGNEPKPLEEFLGSYHMYAEDLVTKFLDELVAEEMITIHDRQVSRKKPSV